MSKLTVEDLKEAVLILKKNEVRPCIVKNKKEARLMNEYDRSLGLIPTWKVGDEYYILEKKEK